MPARLALATSISLLAVLDTWLFVGPLVIALPAFVWVSFLAWGCHYHCGGGSKGATATIACMSWGAVVGAVVAILATGPFSGAGQFGAPIAVGLGVVVICLSSAVSLLSAIPASLYGFAAIAAPILLGGMRAQDAILPMISAIIIGTVFGYVSETLATALTRKRARSA
mgnify:CR=1 FL=1